MAIPMILVAGIAEERLDELKKYCQVTVGPKHAGADWYQDHIQGYDGLLAANIKVDKALINAGKQLKIITSCGVGFDHIDVDYAASQGIVVSNCPVSVMQPTAEMAFTMLLGLTRKIHIYDSSMRFGKFLDTSQVQNQGQSPMGKTLGIFGMGRIGQTLAGYARAFGMSVLYHNRHRLSVDKEREIGASYVSFEDLLRKSDYLSLNAPATPETYHVIDQAALALMQPTAFLINTARGSLVDEAALLAALKEGQIAGAGLDVFENEPHCNPEFRKLDNVILTPHAGSATKEARRNVLKEATNNLVSFLVEGVPVNRVN